MGTRFDRWLARPSTLCFLRQLVGKPLPSFARPHLVPKSQCRGTATIFVSMLSKEKDKKDDQEEDLIHRAESEHPKVPFANRATRKELQHDISQLQADVSTNALLGTLPVDSVEQYELAVEAWVNVLELRQRLEGNPGIREVWLGMRKQGFDLPVAGRHADYLWETFIHAAAADDNLPEIVAYACGLKDRENVQYDRLYSCIVGYSLVVLPSSAVSWHCRLLEAGFVPPDPMKQVVHNAILPKQHGSAGDRFRKFRALYRKTTERNLYDDAISLVLATGIDEVRALKWHRLFITSGDAPSNAVFGRPDVQRLFDLDQDKSLPMRRARFEGRLPADNTTATVAYPPMTRAYMSGLVGEVHGIKPKVISDTFVAKMIATRAFSVDAILSGISIFGIDTIEPLAMRELALRAGTPVEFCNAMSTLEKADIKRSDAVFCRLLYRMASERNDEGFHALLHRDQHHETYEDAELQESILTSQLGQSDWPQVSVTLAALSIIGPDAKARSWNRVLQHYISNRHFPKIVHTLEQMKAGNTTLTLSTCASLGRHILPIRRRGRQSAPLSRHVSQYDFDPYSFVAQAFMYAEDHGLELRGAWTWEYLITTLGIQNRWNIVEQIILKLAETRGQWIKQYLSDPETQGQLVVWGFRDGSTRKPEPYSPHLRPLTSDPVNAPESWSRGLILVRTMNKVHGIPVSDLHAVRRPLLSRLMNIFGPGSSGKRLNNEARRNNRHTLAHYIRHANVIWPDLFSDIPAHLLDGDLVENHPHLLRVVFGPKWRVNKKRQQYLDVEAWTKHLLETKQYIPKPIPFVGRMPFTFYDDDSAVAENTLRSRREYETVLKLAGRPGAYGTWIRARRARMAVEGRPGRRPSDRVDNVPE